METASRKGTGKIRILFDWYSGPNYEDNSSGGIAGTQLVKANIYKIVFVVKMALNRWILLHIAPFTRDDANVHAIRDIHQSRSAPL